MKQRLVNQHSSVLPEFSVHVCFLSAYLYVWKGHAYDKVARPVAAASESDGRGPGSLAKQLSNYEPWDGSRTNFKETHKEEDGWHADVAHPRVVRLEGGVKRHSLVHSCFFVNLNLWNAYQKVSAHVVFVCAWHRSHTIDSFDECINSLQKLYHPTAFFYSRNLSSTLSHLFHHLRE